MNTGVASVQIVSIRYENTRVCMKGAFTESGQVVSPIDPLNVFQFLLYFFLKDLS